MASNKSERAIRQLDAKLAAARWSEVLEHSSELLSQPAPPFASCFRATTLAFEALERPWEALFFALLWDQAAPASEAKEWLDRRAPGPPALPANAAELVASVAASPSTWQAQPAQWVVKALSLLRDRCREPRTSSNAALTLMEGFLRLDKGGTRSAQQKARPLLEAVVAEQPSFLEGLSLLARARFADGDVAGAEDCVRQALFALELPTQTGELAAVARGLEIERPSRAKLLSGLRWMLVQSNQHGEANPRICEVANEELALPGVNRREVLRHLVEATLTLGRHNEALASLRALLDEGDPDEEGELHYWLAREWMRTGRNQAEALSALRVAIERDAQKAHGFASKVESEPLFEPLLHEGAFLLAVHGIPSSEEVEDLLATAGERQLAGESRKALYLAKQAVQKAHLLEQPLTLAKALGLLAQLQTTLGSPQEAVTTFQQALELTAALQHAGRTPLAHGLALALQDAGQLQEAAELYERVLENGARDELAPEEHGLAMANAWRLALQQGKLERAAELRQRLEALFAKARGGDRTKTSTPALAVLFEQARAQALDALTSACSASEREAVYQRLRGLLRGYPGALPLSRAALGSLVSLTEATVELRKSFLTLVMLPVEERVGKWCFAGKSPSFAEALKTLDAFAEAAQIRRSGTLLEDMLANEQMDFAVHPRSAWSYESLPLDSIGLHTLVFLAEGGAPYDDFAVCVLEVPSFTGAPIARRKPRIPRHKQ